MTFDFIILCLFSGSKLGSPVTSAVTRRQSRVYFVDCEGILTPILRTWVQKSTLLLQNRGHAEVLKKDPFFREIRNAGATPLCTLVPPPGVQRTSAFPNHSACYDGILSHRDVILSQIQPIEVAAFVLYFAETSCHKSCAHSKFRPNGLRNCNLFQGISTYAYANQKHFFAEGLHKLLYARNI